MEAGVGGWVVIAACVFASSFASAEEIGTSEYHWIEVLPSRSWCTVLENGSPVLDLAHIYEFTSDNKVSTRAYTAKGFLPAQIDDVGFWNVEKNQLEIRTINQAVILTVKAVVPVKAHAKAIVQPGLIGDSSFCLEMSGPSWSATHCPCKPARFEPGLDI